MFHQPSRYLHGTLWVQVRWWHWCFIIFSESLPIDGAIKDLKSKNLFLTIDPKFCKWGFLRARATVVLHVLFNSLPRVSNTSRYKKLKIIISVKFRKSRRQIWYSEVLACTDHRISWRFVKIFLQTNYWAPPNFALLFINHNIYLMIPHYQ